MRIGFNIHHLRKFMDEWILWKNSIIRSNQILGGTLVKTLRINLTIFVLALLYLMLSSPVALASNIIIDDDAQPAVSGLYLTSNYRNDAACIQAALDNSKSGDTITIREGDYYITTRLHQKDKSLTIIGEGEVTLHLQTAAGSQNGLYFEGSTITRGTLSKDAKEGASQVVLSDASLVKKNDLIKIWKQVQWCPLDYPDQMTGEMYKVESVSGNTVTLNEPLLRDYKLSDTVKTEVFRPIEMHIKNIRVQDSGSTTVHEGLSLRFCKDSSVTDCWFKDSGLAAISFYSSFNVDASNNEIYNCLKPGSGYGVGVWSGTAFANIENNHIENCRHAVTGNTDERISLVRDVVVTKNYMVGANIAGANVIDAHNMAINYEVTKNEVYPGNSYYAFGDGTQYSVFAENKVYGGYGAVATRGSTDNGIHIVRDNYVEGVSAFTFRGIYYGMSDTLIIENNRQNGGRYGVGFFSADSGEGFDHIIIRGNTFSNINNQGIYIDLAKNDESIKVLDNTFENIKKEGIYIDGKSFTNGDLEIQNNVLINVYPSSPGSEIIHKNIQNVLVNGNQINNGNQIVKVPVAAFSASPVSGNAPLKITFTDTSTNSPTSWGWKFGDGATSTSRNPTHTYSTAGNYEVSLTATNGAGSNTATGTAHVTPPEKPVPEDPAVSDNRLREASPDIVYQSSSFIDVGGMNSSRYRDVTWFDLSEYVDSAEINKATLSLYWYYPEGSSRPEDTVIEVYRPASTWNSSYVSWNKRDKDIAWNNAGGDWYDNNGVLQGSAPYATITLTGSEIPDNRYYELDVTDLVKEYVSDKCENTGFLIKARTESNNYIAFYSSDCGNESQKPKLNVEKKVPPVIVTDTKDNRLREASPETVFLETPYIDVGGKSTGRSRGLTWFNLREYVDSAEINKATLSLYWYYPEGSSRPDDTVIEVYRPASTWNSSYVSWNKRDKDIAWNNAGGDWYDNNGVLQGSAPYATITLKGSEIPDNRYYELDVTNLVKEYVSDKCENTGFLIKARTESNNYIAFYSSDCGNESQKPKLNVEKKAPVVIENVIVTGAKDNRLRESFPKTVFQDRPYIDIGGIDIGGIDDIGRYRDVMWFDLSEYAGSEISSATLSLYWYYPAESRPENTVVEVYRPSSWNPDYVSWNKMDKDIAWKNPGGDWYDNNGVLQGSTPYATITLKGSDLPDNRYYELDVTDLVKEYVSDKCENTGFLIKARTESNNYIAFYSSDCGNENQVPKLQLVYS